MRPGMSVLLLLALACGKASADAVRARGRAHLVQGRYDLAIKALDSAIAMKPDDADAYIIRGNAYAAKHDMDGAIQSYGSAIALRPNQSFAYRNRGISYTAKGELDRAIKDLDRAIALQPGQSSTFSSRGYAYQLKGDYERALQDYGRSIDLSPGSAAVLRNRANVHFILGHFADATRDYERALSYYQAETGPTEPLSEMGGYGVIWLRLAKMRQGQADAEQFTANAARVDSTTWPSRIVAFSMGKLTAEQLIALADSGEASRRGDQRCGAELFIAETALSKNQAAEARKRFEATLSACTTRDVERAVAEAELRRLGVGRK